ncbi:HD domain-containing protein [Patescibacteria group bacterium]|nr:HD domain-containing protein [Patescibacteria group bacterium]
MDYSNEDFFEIQKAIKFLTDSCLLPDGSQKELKTAKPLVAHSLRVAFQLIEENDDRNLVIAAILHDLVEDAGVDIDIIEKEFGLEVTDIVKAVTYDLNHSDEAEKGERIIQQALRSSDLVIKLKVYDAIDNMKYYTFTPADEKRKEAVLKRCA